MKEFPFFSLAAVPGVAGAHLAAATSHASPYAPAAASPVVAPTAPVTGAAASGAAQKANGALLSGLPDVNLSWSGYFEALAILCFLLALIWLVLWLLKRRGGSSGIFAPAPPCMRIESRLALGPKKWLLVVRYLDRRLVLGVTEENIRLLTELYDHDAPPASPLPSAAPSTSAAPVHTTASAPRIAPATAAPVPSEVIETSNEHGFFSPDELDKDTDLYRAFPSLLGKVKTGDESNEDTDLHRAFPSLLGKTRTGPFEK